MRKVSFWKGKGDFFCLRFTDCDILLQENIIF